MDQAPPMTLRHGSATDRFPSDGTSSPPPRDRQRRATLRNNSHTLGNSPPFFAAVFVVVNKWSAMSIHQFDSEDAAVAVTENPCTEQRPSGGVPSLEEIPLHVRNVAALRGLGYSFRQIGQSYGVTPQAASVMLTRQRALLKGMRRQKSELTSLSPRAVNCLGRLGIHSREEARQAGDLQAKLTNQRNCGSKTIQEIIDWAAA